MADIRDFDHCAKEKATPESGMILLLVDLLKPAKGMCQRGIPKLDGSPCKKERVAKLEGNPFDLIFLVGLEQKDISWFSGWLTFEKLTRESGHLMQPLPLSRPPAGLRFGGGAPLAPGRTAPGAEFGQRPPGDLAPYTQKTRRRIARDIFLSQQTLAVAHDSSRHLTQPHIS